LEQFSDLGSGFNIAMKDLEIRGAGDLLGGEQSGFINEIGFDTYQKNHEAIEELKENEFKDLYPTENNLETKGMLRTCKSKLILNCCSLMNTSITLAND
jgi:transcription-repair coupling factor (superfamily II helicase)